MIKLQDPAAIAGNSYHSESHTFTNTRKIQHVPIGGQEGQTSKTPQCLDILHHHIGLRRESPDSVVILLINLTRGLFFQLFLDRVGKLH